MWKLMARSLLVVLSACITLLAAPAWAATPQPASAALQRLPALGVDAQGVSVSGLSSGGYMAGQFAVAYAGTVKGVAVLAGGPYGCSRGSMLTALRQCACVAGEGLVRKFSCDIQSAGIYEVYADGALRRNRGRIDDPALLARQRLWLFSGGEDPVVDVQLVDAVEAFWRRHGANAEAVHHERRGNAGHGYPVMDAKAGCNVTASPFINDCDLDAAGALLDWLYPGAAKAAGGGSLQAFSQARYTQGLGGHGLDKSGWVYVPTACQAAGAACSLHVVFHGCSQAAGSKLPGGEAYGQRYVDGTGYLRWAEQHRLVLLFPQVRPSGEETRVGRPGFNPEGCWDFWGYSTGDADRDPLRFATREAPQMRAVKAMIDDLMRR